jgi:hypothetical protein
MLDALIANQDRHHENWGVICFPARNEKRLAPSYDHASSMGRNETDERRLQLLGSDDHRRNIVNYVNRAASAFYDSSEAPKRLKTADAFFYAARRKPQIAIRWLERLLELKDRNMEALLDKVPQTEISETAKRFAIEILRQNKKRLLGLEKQLK